MNKEWYKSKTIWVSVAALLTAVTTAMGFNIPVDFNVLIIALLGVMGVTLRTAIPEASPVKKK